MMRALDLAVPARALAQKHYAVFHHPQELVPCPAPAAAAVAGEAWASERCAAALAVTCLTCLTTLRHRNTRRRCSAVLRRARGGEEIIPQLRGAVAEEAPLATQDEWIQKLDLEGFGREVHELGERLKTEQGEADQEHLAEMVTWSRCCAALGLATMWLPPNPITIVALSLWTHSAWTMIGHHVCHGGYNRSSSTYNSRGFALGSAFQRLIDWFDWMLPEAWNVEHNQQHHFRLGEDADPDLVERNVEAWSGTQKLFMPYLSMLTWKWSYYAPNTYKELKMAEWRKQGKPLPEGFDPLAPLTVAGILAGKAKGLFSFEELLGKVMAPYFLWRFILMPLPLALLDPTFYFNAVVSLLLADVLSNIHGFIVIVTNHAGSDLYRFETGCKPKSPTFYLRAVTSSANFTTGGNLNDFMHGWLNYQIEHHAWPDLSMLAYQKGQPELKEICRKYGVPYVQENVFVRLKKTLEIMMGFTRMRMYPVQYESKKDSMLWAGDAYKVSS